MCCPIILKSVFVDLHSPHCFQIRLMRKPPFHLPKALSSFQYNRFDESSEPCPQIACCAQYVKNGQSGPLKTEKFEPPTINSAYAIKGVAIIIAILTLIR